ALATSIRVFPPPVRVNPAMGIETRRVGDTVSDLRDPALRERVGNRTITGQLAELVTGKRHAEGLFKRHHDIQMADRVPIARVLGRQRLADLLFRHFQGHAEDVSDAIVHEVTCSPSTTTVLKCGGNASGASASARRKRPVSALTKPRDG